MDERLQKLMQDLGNAINESLADSEKIAEAISEIRGEGYDVFLVLEATIGFNKREESETAGEEAEGKDTAGKAEAEPEEEIPFTTQDEKFLRSLKITIDE